MDIQKALQIVTTNTQKDKIYCLVPSWVTDEVSEYNEASDILHQEYDSTHFKIVDSNVVFYNSGKGFGATFAQFQNPVKVIPLNSIGMDQKHKRRKDVCLQK